MFQIAIPTIGLWRHRNVLLRTLRVNVAATKLVAPGISQELEEIDVNGCRGIAF
jgi:hypothetical protein